LESETLARRAAALEGRLSASPPDSWKGSSADWFSLCHLSAGLGFYRASLIAVFWQITDSDGDLSDVLRVDALKWTLNTAEASLRATPLAGSLLTKTLRQDHSQSFAGPRYDGPGRDLGEIDPALMCRAKTHLEWVLENSNDTLQRKLAGAWMTEMLNDLHRWRRTANSISDGLIPPIDGIDADQWLKRLDEQFPESERRSRHYYERPAL
jgi:hypothetical protein